MTAYLQEHLTDSLGMSNIEPDFDLRPLGLENNTADIIWRLQRDLSLRIYPQETLAHPTLKLMAEYAAEALKKQQNWMKLEKDNPAVNGNDQNFVKLSSTEAPVAIPSKEKNRTIVFLLSAPRSGSTLLRLMLAGHPALFCPPELALLAYDSLSDWQAHQQAFFSQTGFQQALSNLQGLDDEGIQAKLEELSKQERPILATYRFLQETAAPRTLVDKTPGYALNPAILARAEAYFQVPKYIHLVRHPYPVIESFVRNRLHIVLGQSEANPAGLGETVWLQSNQNLIDFGQQVTAERYLQIMYEELVRNPQTIMEQLCNFLKIPFDESILRPYTGERMIAGPGDPDILQHDDIDPELGYIWQKIQLPWPLRPETRALAMAFGYELPADRNTMDSNDSKEGHLPDNLEELTDAEVDAMLRQLMEE